MTVEIYGLSDPVTGELRYIGKAVNSSKRFQSHVRDSRRRETPVYRWFRKLAKDGLLPVLAILEVCPPGSDWKVREIALIAEHKLNCRLLNVALGGDEPFCPIEVRVANAKKVAATRHKHIHRAYRMLEYSARMMAKLFPCKVRKDYKALFMANVQKHRAAGTMDALDAALGESFKSRPLCQSWG